MRADAGDANQQAGSSGNCCNQALALKTPVAVSNERYGNFSTLVFLPQHSWVYATRENIPSVVIKVQQ
jgi:hypothetical protein